MTILLHDSAQSFRFVLGGVLAGDAVRELESAWETAKSILAGKELLVDVSGVTDADHAGFELLYRMTGSGARLIAALPPASREFLRSLGIAAAPRSRPGRFARLFSGRRRDSSTDWKAPLSPCAVSPGGPNNGRTPHGD
jgi:ABC-type transporter Mla MlaB component